MYTKMRPHQAYGETFGDTARNFSFFGEEASLHPWFKGPVVLSCPSDLLISVSEATFGSNLLNPGVPGDGFSLSHKGCKGARGTGKEDGIRGNRTDRFKAACDGLNKCEGRAKPEQGGDPDPHRGCPKDFAISWTCNQKSGQFINNRWACSQPLKPTTVGEKQAYCCPSGWTISSFNDPNPCIKEQDLYDCGPLPAGESRDTMACCGKAAGKWSPKSGGKDPCVAFNTRGIDIIAAPDITPEDVASARKSVLTPGLLLAGGGAVVLLLVLMIFK